MILAHIPTLQGGAWNEFTGKCYQSVPISVKYADALPVLKQNRITAIASENNLPLIALVQSVSTGPAKCRSDIPYSIIGWSLSTSAVPRLSQGRSDIPRSCSSI
jgi:hypothetical protein